MRAHQSRWMIILFCIQLGMLGGCVTSSSTRIPHDWSSQPVLKAHSNERLSPTLQIIITYSGLASSHSALRLVAPDEQVIFWDPGGDYGRFDDDWNAEYGPLPENIQRDQDLILSHPPEIGTFVRWRWTLDDTRVEVFEWDLSASRAQKFREVLLHGTDDTHSKGRFSTWTYPLFCTMAMSDFLQRFAYPMIRVHKRYFFPNKLAKVLYTQSPSRVHVFTRDGKTAVYSPPGPRSVRQ